MDRSSAAWTSVICRTVVKTLQAERSGSCRSLSPVLFANNLHEEARCGGIGAAEDTDLSFLASSGGVSRVRAHIHDGDQCLSCALMGDYLNRLGDRLRTPDFASCNPTEALSEHELRRNFLCTRLSRVLPEALWVLSTWHPRADIPTSLHSTWAELRRMSRSAKAASVSLEKRRSMDCLSAFRSLTSTLLAPAAARLPNWMLVVHSKSGPQARAQNLDRSATEREANVSQ